MATSTKQGFNPQEFFEFKAHANDVFILLISDKNSFFNEINLRALAKELKTTGFRHILSNPNGTLQRHSGI